MVDITHAETLIRLRFCQVNATRGVGRAARQGDKGMEELCRVSAARFEREALELIEAHGEEITKALSILDGPFRIFESGMKGLMGDPLAGWADWHMSQKKAPGA